MVKHKALYFFITLAQKEKLTPFAGIEKKREKGKNHWAPVMVLYHISSSGLIFKQ